LEQEIGQKKRFTAFGERISTGCGVLDELFDSCGNGKGKGTGMNMGVGGGGVERGIVVGISAGDEREGLLVSSLKGVFF